MPNLYEKLLAQALKDKVGSRDDLARFLADELAAEMDLTLLAEPSYTYEETGVAAAWPIILPTPEPPGFYRLAVNVEMQGYDPTLSPPYAILERGSLDYPEHLAVFEKRKSRWYTVKVWPKLVTIRELDFFPDIAHAIRRFGS